MIHYTLKNGSYLIVLMLALIASAMITYTSYQFIRYGLLGWNKVIRFFINTIVFAVTMLLLALVIFWELLETSGPWQY